MPVAIEGFPLLPSGRELVPHRHGARRGLCPGRLVERRALRGRQPAARGGLGRMGRRCPAGHSVLASGSPSAISTAISVTLRSRLLAVGFAAGRRGYRARRRAAADGRSAVSFALAGAGVALLLGLQMGFSARLDHDPARCRPGASGTCDALAHLSGARLAERRRRARRAAALSRSTRPSSASDALSTDACVQLRCCRATACRRLAPPLPPGSSPAPPAAGRGWSWRRRPRSSC